MYVYKGADFEIGINKALPSGFRQASDIQANINRQLQSKFADRFTNIAVQYTNAGTAYVTGTSLMDRGSEQDIYSDVLIALSGAGLTYSRANGGVLLHNNTPKNPAAKNPQSAPTAKRKDELAQQDGYIKQLEAQSSFAYQFQKQIKDDLNAPLVAGVPTWAVVAGIVVVVLLIVRR